MNKSQSAISSVTSNEVFQMLGRLSVLFSTLESEMSSLLCLLVHPQESALAATILEGNSFSKTLALLEKVAPFSDTTMETKVSRLLKLVKPLRPRRNLFVHGRWDVSPKLLDQGKIEVSDSKMQFERTANRKTWTKGKAQTLTIADLQEHQLSVMRALKMTKEILDELIEKADQEAWDC